MAKLRVFLPPGVSDVWALTSAGGWKGYNALKARHRKGWRWATFSSMPRGAYSLVWDIGRPENTFEAFPDIEPARMRIRWFAGDRDEEIRPLRFKEKRSSIWN